jgi:hypothetical protein
MQSIRTDMVQIRSCGETKHAKLAIDEIHNIHKGHAQHGREFGIKFENELSHDVFFKQIPGPLEGKVFKALHVYEKEIDIFVNDLVNG